MQKYDAFIAAGGKSSWLKDLCNTEYRCLAVINGQRILDYILTALNASQRINKIVIAVAPEALPILQQSKLPDNVTLCAAAANLPATAATAAKYLTSSKILGVCDDIPLLTAQGINDFLNQCEKDPAIQLYYPIIAQATCLKQFPQGKRTYGKLQDGTFTGGNMMLIAQEIIPKGQQKALELFKLRKSPLKLASWLGWTFILKLLFRQLTIKDAEQRFSKLMEIQSKAIITDYAGIGMDMDKPADWDLIKKYLTQNL